MITTEILSAIALGKLGINDVVIPRILLHECVPEFQIGDASVSVRGLTPEQWFLLKETAQKNITTLKSYHAERAILEQKFKLAILLRHPPGWNYV